MTKCCIVNCGARKGKNQPQLLLHRFPRNEKLKKEWLDAIGEENFNPRLKEWFLCSLHFKESCFNRTLDVMRLHDNSVPTLFLALDKKQQQKSSVLCETQNLDVSCASTVASLQLPQQIVETVHIERDTSLPSIPTFSQNLDNILGNDGIQLGGLTELLGLPGTGKTQLCLQLCASIQVPKILGGLNSESLYIDTNTNFTPYRYREILNASLQRCQQLVPTAELNEEEALKKLNYVKAFGLEKFCAFMHRMPKFIADHPNIRLIVIDSIAFPFKEGIPAKQRTGLLFRQMAELQRIAIDNQIAVVVTNEMSTRVGLPGGSVVGAMGDAWAHRCNTRLLLTTRGQGPRLALIVKSNATTNAVAEFQITKDGIRDVN